MTTIDWIDVDDRMPGIAEEDEELLIVSEEGMIFHTVWYNYFYNVTHRNDEPWLIGGVPIKYWATVKEQFAHLPNAQFGKWRDWRSAERDE